MVSWHKGTKSTSNQWKMFVFLTCEFAVSVGQTMENKELDNPHINTYDYCQLNDHDEFQSF